MTRHSILDFSQIRTYPLNKRSNRIGSSAFAQPCRADVSFADFLNGLPHILAARDLRGVAQAVANARLIGKPVILGMGGHVVKVGLSPLLIHLMEQNVVTALAMNGSTAIHDFEVALIGETSEDVAEGLKTGAFGMVEETGKLMNEAIKESAATGEGLGRALGHRLRTLAPPFLEHSLLAAAARLDIPATVHVAIGTDIIHMHPAADGAAIGRASLQDFRTLAAVVAQMGDGGVYINLGSAVVLPEVFVKALTIARNLGHPVNDFVTVNMDMIQHYRPRENVVRRPTLDSGRGYTITGHHEIMFPLLAQAVIEELGRPGTIQHRDGQQEGSAKGRDE